MTSSSSCCPLVSEIVLHMPKRYEVLIILIDSPLFSSCYGHLTQMNEFYDFVYGRSFLPRNKYSSAVYTVDMFPSVCSLCHKPGVVPSKRRITETTPYDNPRSFLVPKVLVKLPWRHPYRAPNTGGVGNNQGFSTNTSLYLRNGSK